MKPEIQGFEKIVSAARNAVVVSHFSPDGDAVGSTMALSLYLSSRGIDVTPVLPSIYPGNLSYIVPETMPCLIFEQDKERALDAIRRADVIFCMDVSSLSRTEYLEEAIASSKAVRMLIDHHEAQERKPFDEVVATTQVSSTCELLFWMLMQMKDVAGDASKLSAECRDALYSGMMTDTNNFSNSVFPSTFEMGARMIAAGVDKIRLQERVFWSNSENRIKLQGYLLKDKLAFVPQSNRGFKAAYMVLTQAEKDSFNYQPGDSEGFVNIPLSVEGVGISALFTETTTGYIRVSLRSRVDIDVNTFARAFFNGGGHKNAAGGRLYITPDEVPAYFLNALEKHFGKDEE